MTDPTADVATVAPRWTRSRPEDPRGAFVWRLCRDQRGIRPHRCSGARLHRGVHTGRRRHAAVVGRRLCAARRVRALRLDRRTICFARLHRPCLVPPRLRPGSQSEGSGSDERAPAADRGPDPSRRRPGQRRGTTSHRGLRSAAPTGCSTPRSSVPRQAGSALRRSCSTTRVTRRVHPLRRAVHKAHRGRRGGDGGPNHRAQSRPGPLPRGRTRSIT